MPLTKEILERDEHGRYPEPDGEIIEVLDLSRGRLRLLTRVSEENHLQAPFDPSEYTVDVLRDKLSEMDLSDDERTLLIEEEVDGKDRTTALNAIKDL